MASLPARMATPARYICRTNFSSSGSNRWALSQSGVVMPRLRFLHHERASNGTWDAPWRQGFEGVKPQSHWPLPATAACLCPNRVCD